MPPRFRQLKATLAKAGFSWRPSKGSHTIWHHPDMPGFTVSVSGNDSKDAKPYQIDDVRDALERLRRQK